jgi:hypothetical protein
MRASDPAMKSAILDQHVLAAHREIELGVHEQAPLSLVDVSAEAVHELFAPDPVRHHIQSVMARVQRLEELRVHELKERWAKLKPWVQKDAIIEDAARRARQLRR